MIFATPEAWPCEPSRISWLSPQTLSLLELTLQPSGTPNVLRTYVRTILRFNKKTVEHPSEMIASCGFCALQIIDCVPHGNRMLDSVDEFLHSFFVGCSGGSMCPHYKAKNPAKTNLPWLGNMVLQTLPESLQENVPPSWVWLVVGPWAASKMLLRKSL